LNTQLELYRELQNKLTNNYISKETYDQHVSKCTSDIQSLNNTISQLNKLKDELRTRLNKYEPCLDAVLERENGSKYFEVTVCNNDTQLFFSKEKANEHCWSKQFPYLLSSRGIENGNPCLLTPGQKIRLSQEHLFYNNGNKIAPAAHISDQAAREDGLFNTYIGTASWSGM
jgi:hypothetical protein